MRPLVAAALGALVLFLFVPIPAQADYGPDCDDFVSAEAAQNYYESQGGLAGGDPDGLDRDHDGNACDWGAPPPDWGDGEYDDTGYSDSEPVGYSTNSNDGLPWWAWAGGGLAGLWLIGIIRWNT